jgi:UDP-N-acetylmuramoyl-L-alanyl-D-glutamate--2,6-diaminopimelate ligase
MNNRQLIETLSETIETQSSLEFNFELEDIFWKIETLEKPGILFFKITDENSEQRLYQNIEKLKQQQIVLLLNKRPSINLSSDLSFIVIKESSWMDAQKKLLDYFYPMEKEVKIIGVTGTNGKTSTTFFAHQLLNQIGVNSIYIGGLGVYQNGLKTENFYLTSPNYIDLRKTIFKWQRSHRVFLLEVSSHALEQERVYKLKFNQAAWMSFGQDHLDFHGTMNAYFLAKKKILNHLPNGVKLIVPSSQKQLIEQLNGDQIDQVDILDRLEYARNDLIKVDFNKQNISIAFELLKRSGFDLSLVDLEKITPVPGRFNIHKVGGKIVIIDSAHTPDALVNICEAILKNYPGQKIYSVFGCGGDRDRLKRPMMAEALRGYSEHLYITSDNPRGENPEQIIDDIIIDLSPSEYTREVDRASMIQRALHEVKKGVVLLAGKGHENYIIVKGQYLPYSDEEQIKIYMKNHD